MRIGRGWIVGQELSFAEVIILEEKGSNGRASPEIFAKMTGFFIFRDLGGSVNSDRSLPSP